MPYDLINPLLLVTVGGVLYLVGWHHGAQTRRHERHPRQAREADDLSDARLAEVLREWRDQG